MVSVHSELVRSLGIEKLLAVVGGSLGGMQVLDWSVRFPDQMSSCVVLASAPKLAAQGIAFNAVGRRAIAADPGFLDGNYYDADGPRYGLALARMVAHITYLSEDSIELKFGRRLQNSDQFAFDIQKETEFQIESYLHYQGKRFVQRFDANSYLYLTRAMDYFDLADGKEALNQAVADVQARFLIASYDTDWLFPTSQSQELVAALLSVGKHVSFTEHPCPYGHDSFLIDIEPLNQIVSPFLHQTFRSVTKTIDSIRNRCDMSSRRYQIADPSAPLVDELIMRHIDRGRRVIDLGCGDGRLMLRLKNEMDCHVVGVDFEQSNVASVIRHGMPVVAADLNQPLVEVPSDAFDYAVLSQTLQQVQNPKQLLKEMLRVANRALVVVPNFGHWRVRYEVLRRGRTPITTTLPYEWHESPNMHFMSMRDFRELMEDMGLRIVKERPIINGRSVDKALAANLRADSAFYLLERSS